jgi:hypothetical protein
MFTYALYALVWCGFTLQDKTCLAYRAEKDRGNLVAELDSLQASNEGLQKAKVRSTKQ